MVKRQRLRRRRPQSASAPMLRRRASSASLSRRNTSSESLDAWDMALFNVDEMEEELRSIRAKTSEARMRAARHERQHAAEVRRQRKERKDILEMKRARAARKAAKPKPGLVKALKPGNDDTGGLEGKEMKNWKMRMDVHTKVVSTARSRTSSSLEGHVKRQRKEKLAKQRKRWVNATPEDAGLTGKPLHHWKMQRDLHDRVVQSAKSRLDTKHLPHIKKERKRLRAKVEAKHRNFSLEDGGLEGPQKEHWHHMRALHDEIVGTAKVAVDTKLDKHVLSFRREINRKKKLEPVRDGVRGRELRHWMKILERHNEVIDQASPKIVNSLDKHQLEKREARMEKSRKRFENYDVESGGLEGRELKTWNAVKEIHERLIANVEPRVDMSLPRHVEKERHRLAQKMDEKYAQWDVEDGGLHGKELAHWKAMRQIHSRVVGAAKASVSMGLPEHIQRYRKHLQKQSKEKFAAGPDGAGLSGKELAWWRKQLELHDRVVGGAQASVDQALPAHVARNRARLKTLRHEKDRRFDVSDGMLGGPELEHWKKMRAIHDELIATARPATSAKLSKRAKELRRYYRDKLKKKQQANAEEFTAGLEGPELHHWLVMQKRHDRIVSEAEVQVDTFWPGDRPKSAPSGRKKRTSGRGMPKPKPPTPMSKVRAERRKQRAAARMQEPIDLARALKVVEMMRNGEFEGFAEMTEEEFNSRVAQVMTKMEVA
eukprot:g3011.t1